MDDHRAECSSNGIVRGYGVALRFRTTFCIDPDIGYNGIRNFNHNLNANQVL